MINIRPDEISSIIREQIENYDQDVKVDNIGTVLQVGDGIARVYGVMNCMAMELLEFGEGVMGLALNLEEDNVGVAIMGDDTEIREGDVVKRTGRIAEIPVGDGVLGRVLDAVGNPLDGKGPINTTETRRIEMVAQDQRRDPRTAIDGLAIVPVDQYRQRQGQYGIDADHQRRLAQHPNHRGEAQLGSSNASRHRP